MRQHPLAILAIALALASCATPETDDFPSLAIRDAERASGQMEPVEPAPYVPPATPAEVLDRLDQLVAEANTAHEEFEAEADRTRRLVSAASGAQAGSESWAQAQVALAGLESSRSRAMVALADLDRLYVDASVEAAQTERIAAARDRVVAMVDAENTLIDSLLVSLR